MFRPYLLLACLTLIWGAAHASAGKPHAVHALTHARLVVAPGKIIENGTLIVRDGRIEAVGDHVTIPSDARVWDVHGKTIHAGFIDPYVTLSRLQGRALRSNPHSDWDDEENSDEEEKDAPKDVVHSGEASNPNPRVHPDWHIADHLSIKKKVAEELWADGYVAVQAVPDEGIFRGASAIYTLQDGGLLKPQSGTVIAFDPRYIKPSESSYPGSMMGNVALIRQVFSDAAWYRQAQAVSEASYQGTKRPRTDEALAALAPVMDGNVPVVCEATTLLELLRMHRVLGESGIHPTLTVLSGEEWRNLAWAHPLASSGEFVLPLELPAVPKAKGDAEWLDVTLLSLQRWRNGPALPRWLQDDGWHLSFSTHRLKSLDRFAASIHRIVEAGMKESDVLAALTTRPAAQLHIGDRFGTLEPGKSASFVVRKGDLFAEDGKVLEVWVEGTRHVVAEDEETEKSDTAAKSKKHKAPEFSAADYAKPPVPDALPKQTAVLVRGATIWTEGPGGVLKDADLLVQNGRILALGKGLVAPPGAVVVDGRGLHVTPGLIDCHNHTAIDGDVNESTDSVTCQVRIKDVLNAFDPNIYRELAGGTTIANVLHGSANTIGGQVVTCKFRWGEAPQNLVMEGAPEGVKFALGENPKQSNWGDNHRSRYPQTRMGVAELIRERFAAARDYRRQQEEYDKTKAGVPPRRDYQLEALLEILDGKRFVHCHSYRQDEILSLIRIADAEGFKVRTFQHVLEGYKVADELAAHGAGGSTFSDWWAYKYEVIDAIPYNGTLMHDRGVVVSFNSDSPDQSRRLNTEAAKAVRYGGLSETEALAFVTINPARQLGIEKRVGSLEPGKDGDFVVWSDHPLSQKAICLQTWIDGKKYFDQAQDAVAQTSREAVWKALVARAKDAGKESDEK